MHVEYARYVGLRSLLVDYAWEETRFCYAESDASADQLRVPTVGRHNEEMKQVKGERSIHVLSRPISALCGTD